MFIPIFDPSRIAKSICNGLEEQEISHYNFRFFGPLAQSVEHCTFNAVVAGSNPARPTRNIKGLQRCRPFLFWRAAQILRKSFLRSRGQSGGAAAGGRSGST